GHKLIDNTYIFFTSDNGGMEGSYNEVITDNAPLDRGKMSAKEGGVRVPFLVAGPGIAGGKESDVVVNGLDFYPTILSMSGIAKPEGKNLDGADLLPLLTSAADDPSLVLDQHGKPRTEMVWHYPHGGATSFQSTIRTGDFKLIRNYDTHSGNVPPLELYRLTETKNGKPVRVDFEESKNLADEMPEKAATLNARLTEILTEMKASLPYWNSDCKFALPNKEKVPAVTGINVDGHTVTATFQENGARVVHADVVYATHGGEKAEEWFRASSEIENGVVKATLPPEATHAYINLVDENHFLVSHPKPVPAPDKNNTYANAAIPLGGPANQKAPHLRKNHAISRKNLPAGAGRLLFFLPGLVRGNGRIVGRILGAELPHSRQMIPRTVSIVGPWIKKATLKPAPLSCAVAILLLCSVTSGFA
ncbi:MAG: sulfatase-like hydrolase/transferase, partial [Spartobacteria bacterium]